MKKYEYEILCENGGYSLLVSGGKERLLFRDLSRQRGEIERLTALLRRNDVGPDAIADVVEDFLAAGGSADGEGDVPCLSLTGSGV